VRPAATETPTTRPPTGRALGTPASVSASLPHTSTPLPVVASPTSLPTLDTTSLPTLDITQESTSPLAVSLPSSTHRPAAITPTTPEMLIYPMGHMQESCNASSASNKFTGKSYMYL